MDGENHGKPYERMDDLGGFPIFLETTILIGFFHYKLSILGYPLFLEGNTQMVDGK